MLAAFAGYASLNLAGAATYANTAEAETGVIAGQAARIDSTDASAAGSVKFGQAGSGPVIYSAPITISAGGTYSGNWESTDTTSPAINITTNQPVTIENCNLRSKTTLIKASAGNANVTVRNCTAYGVNPGVSGKAKGRFFTGENVKNVSLQNNYLEGTGGIYILSYNGNGTSDTIKILRNKAKNIDGRVSNGSGYSTSGEEYYQFVQFDKVQNIPGAEIAWNQVINEPYNSRVEDNVNLYLSGGTAAAPLLVHDNYIQGGYPALPESQEYSGGGIITDGDGSGAAWLKVYNNQIVSTSNYGLALASGHDNVMYNNRVISSGRLPDGKIIKSQNIGVYVWNINGISGFTNNIIRDNVIGWYNASNSSHNDSWFPDCNPANGCTGNTSFKSGQVITASDEAAEFTSWQAKLSSNSVTVGAP